MCFGLLSTSLQNLFSSLFDILNAILRVYVKLRALWYILYRKIWWKSYYNSSFIAIYTYDNICMLNLV